MARGLGTRMRAGSGSARLSGAQERFADAGIKALVPLAGGATLLELIVGRLTKAGFTRICVVIGPEHEAIREFCTERGLNVDFAVQPEPLGTADAVLAAENTMRSEALFAVVNSDNLYPADALASLHNASHPALLAFERKALVERSNIPSERIAKFATLDIDDRGLLTQIVEKPAKVEADSWISMNAWLFSHEIFAACRAIGRSERGEFELASAVQYAIDRLGVEFEAIRVRAAVLDLSGRDDIAAAGRILEGESS